MRAATLTQFLVDITRGHCKDEFAADPELVLGASPLDERMKAAVRERDIGALWSAGAHPMALLYFARASGWDNDRYYKCISDAELRTAAPEVAVPSSGHEPPQMRR